MPAKKKPTTKRHLDWNAYLKKYMKEHPKLSLAEAAEKASPGYRRQ